MAYGYATTRVSEALLTLDPDLDLDLDLDPDSLLLEEAASYVCQDCGRAEPDPIIGFMDGELVFACPHCSPAVLPN